MKKILLFVCLFVLKFSFAQEVKDSTALDSLTYSYQVTRLAPRFGASIQKGYSLECGIFLNTFYTRFPKHLRGGWLPFVSRGFFASSEFVIRDFNNFIIGPKIGWEAGVIGETHGGFYGVEFINYTDFKNYSPALMLKIGIPMKWFNMGYGYTMFFEKTLKDKVGKHRLIVSYTVNRKSERKYKEIQEIWNNRTENKE